MNKIYCSTGALLGRPNKRDFNLLEVFSKELDCDGYELLVYDTWYPATDDLIAAIKRLKLSIPVVHCEKALSEKLAGARVWLENGKYPHAEMTPEEDEKSLGEAIEEFKINLRLAEELGAHKMVFHMWNGLVSDKHIERNIERFGIFKEMAEKAGVLLMAENVICNTFDPLTNMEAAAKKYHDISFVYDTKMSEFHGQTMEVFSPEHRWMFEKGHVKHLHINDYDGGIMDWSNFKVLPIGKGHVDFTSFFKELKKCGYDGDYTVEATAFNREGIVDVHMLNECFADLKKLL